MQSAKKFIDEIRHRDQQHNTEVRETFNPAVTKETIRPVERDEQTVAIDRELHQDHYQTRIQPVEDHVRVEEKHTHNVLPVERREVKHGKDHEIKRKLEQEAAQFKSTTQVLPTEHATVSSGTVAGEHVHHHVHENVQPVIEREVIQPTVIHTTIPIHERIEHEPTFHPATVQPKMTMEDFRKAGGSLEGKPEIRDVFEGEPQVRENGGAHQTHPNAYSSGHHTDHPSGPARDQQMREQQMRREANRDGMRTPPIGAH
ncbi:hypothetical protein EDC01DRAFT_241390 [Geopyxis carbonaria]|nr:hypothetical protein EDC01DRAFT_241390 [Geopyxis carbonaria]